MDHGGWYDRDNTFRNMVDIILIAAMGPPGGGRNKITNRFQRHFNVCSITEFAISTLKHIYKVILDWRCESGGFPDSITKLSGTLIDAVMDVYETSMTKLLPTPSKSHYTFNLRDVSRVVQGMLLQQITAISSDEATARKQGLRLWFHEVMRVFFDRLVDDQDRSWFLDYMKHCTEKHFKEQFNQLFSHLDYDGSGDVDGEELRRCFFGTYMNGTSNFIAPGTGNTFTFDPSFSYGSIVVAKLIGDHPSLSRSSYFNLNQPCIFSLLQVLGNCMDCCCMIFTILCVDIP